MRSQDKVGPGERPGDSVKHIAALMILLVLVSVGCTGRQLPQDNISNVAPSNVTNQTANQSTNNTNQTANYTIPPSEWKRFTAPSFSFEYPADMAVQTTPGIFTGTHELKGQPAQTGELMIVTYLNTTVVYGPNRDDEFKAMPSEATANFLRDDAINDSAKLLSMAYYKGSMTTFTITGDGVVAEMPFKIRFGDSNKTYNGYAFDLYVPDLSLHAKARMIALDQSRVDSMRDQFLLSFRPE